MWVLTSAAWSLLWLITIGLAVWQAVRGRPLAGAALGAAALGGLAMVVAPSLVDLVIPLLAEVLGWPLTIAARRLVLGLGDAAVVALLITGAALQRPS